MKKLNSEQINAKKLTLQYSVLQGCYWSSFCAIYSFATILLLSKGFSSAQIGVIIAIGNILGVIFQPIISGIADRHPRIEVHHLSIALAILAIALYCILGLTPNRLWIAIAILFCITDALAQIIQPMINSVSVYYINHKVDVNFGISRGVGSISYAVVSTALGYLVEKNGEFTIIICGAAILLLMVITLWFLPLINTTLASVQDTSATTTNEVTRNSGIVEFFRTYPRFVLTLVGLVLIFTFHNMTNNYLIQFVEMLGGNSSNMGTTLSIAACLELPTLLIFSKLLKKFNCHQLLIVSAIIFAIKAISYLFIHNIMGLYLAQILQAGSYALYTPASIYYVNSQMQPQDRFRGQALIVGTTTLGGVIGSLMGGFLQDNAGTPALLLAGAILASVGAILVCTFARQTSIQK